jgi:hypothetical protein
MFTRASRSSGVDAALFVPYCRSDTVKIIEVRDISLNGRYILSDQRYRLIQLRLPTPGNKDVGPSFKKRLAVARPIPLLPPVIAATLPSSAAISFSFDRH